MHSVPRINVLGVGVHALNMDLAVRTLAAAVESKHKGIVCVTGVHGLTEAQDNPAFRRLLNEAFLVTPDGMPLVWIGRERGAKEMGRVYGPDLMLEICRLSVDKGYTHYLYGGDVGVAPGLKTALEGRFPGLKVVGTYTPPFRPLDEDEERDLTAHVSEVKPDFLWVGISTPKQELFMQQYLHRLDATVMLGVGAAFDIHTGRTAEAPRWMMAAGLQWLHRLGQEPRRLGRRYLVNNPLFLARIAAQRLGLRRYPL